MNYYLMIIMSCAILLSVDSECGFFQRVQTYFTKKHPVEQLYERIVKEIPYISKAIKRKKYGKVTPEKLYTYHFMIEALFVYIIHVANSDLQKHLINLMQKKNASLKVEIQNAFFDIVTPTKEQQSVAGVFTVPFEPAQLDVINLIIGPGLTLFNLVPPEDFAWENKEGAENENREQKLSLLSQHLTNFIVTMYDFSQHLSSKDTTETDAQKATYYAQQTYATMQKYKLKLIFSEKNYDNAAAVESFLKQENTLFRSKYQKKDIEIKTKLVDLTKQVHAKIKKKIDAEVYTDFINNMMWHAECVSWLVQAIEFAKDAVNYTYLEDLWDYVKALNLYIQSIQDDPILDMMQEHILIKHYRNFLIKKIGLIIQNDAYSKLHFKVKEKFIYTFSQQRIDKLHVYVNDFIKKSIIFGEKPVTIVSKTNQTFKKDVERHIKQLYGPDIRKLLFLQEIIIHAYEPEQTQWAATKDDYVTFNEINDFALSLWQRTVGQFFGSWILKIIQGNIKTNINVSRALVENYLYTFDVTWSDYLKQHNKELFEGIKHTIDLYLAENNSDFLGYKNLFYRYGLYHEKADMSGVMLLANPFAVQIKDIKLCAESIDSLNSFYRFCTILRQNKVMDLVENSGIEWNGGIARFNGLNRTLEVLERVIQALIIGSYRTEVAKAEQYHTLIMLVFDKLHVLRGQLYNYIKTVLYSQDSMPLNDAYITTGHLMIKVVEKLMDTINHKYNLQKSVPHLKFDDVDNAYSNKRSFI